MKIGVVLFPGSNCHPGNFSACKDVMQQNVVKPWHKEMDLKGC